MKKVLSVIFALLVLSFSFFVSLRTIKADSLVLVNSTMYANFTGDNQIKSYSFQTTESSYYAIDVVGNSYLTLEVSDGVNVYRNSGNVFTTEFQSNSSYVTIRIRCSHYVSSTSTFVVRPMIASLYGWDYSITDGAGSINTSSDVANPYSSLNGIIKPYMFTDPLNNGVDHILGEDSRGLKRINSDVFFYSGHAGYDDLQLPGYNQNIRINNIPALDKCKIAVLAGCETALTPETGINISQKFVNNGAKSCIGWEKTISVSYSRTFTNKLFAELADGKTIAQAAVAAKNLFLLGNIRKYVIYGVQEQKLIANNKVSSSILTSPQNMVLVEDVSGYEIENSGLNYYRLYKTINGIRTCEYLDCVLEDGSYYALERSKNTIQGKKIVDFDSKIVEDYVSSLMKSGKYVETECMYLVQDDLLVPSMYVCEKEKNKKDFKEYVLNMNTLEMMDMEKCIYA